MDAPTGFRPNAAPRLLFVALDDYLGIERFPAAMGAAGADCAVLSPPGFTCLASRFIRQWFPLPAHRGLWLGLAFVRRALEKAVRAYAPDLIIPLDDISAQYLRVFGRAANLAPRTRDLLERSFGAPEGYAAVCSRAAAMAAGRRLGIRVPEFLATRESAALLAAATQWGFPVVLKAENSCGGNGVAIAHNADELHSAIRHFHGGPLWRRSRRAAVGAFWHTVGLVETALAPPLLQTYVAGRPAMRTVSAWRGEVLAGMSFLAEAVHPEPTGSSTRVRHIDHPEMAEAVRRFVAASGSSGILSFDFIIDHETGGAVLIEINARPIGTAHLGPLFGQDLCGPLLARLDAAVYQPIAPRPAETRVIALFPKELVRAPQHPERLHDGDVLHDVPFDDPPVLQRHLARLRLTHPAHIAAIEATLEAARIEAQLAATPGLGRPIPPVEGRTPLPAAALIAPAGPVQQMDLA